MGEPDWIELRVQGIVSRVSKVLGVKNLRILIWNDRVGGVHVERDERDGVCLGLVLVVNDRLTDGPRIRMWRGNRSLTLLWLLHSIVTCNGSPCLQLIF